MTGILYQTFGVTSIAGVFNDAINFPAIAFRPNICHAKLLKITYWVRGFTQGTHIVQIRNKDFVPQPILKFPNLTMPGSIPRTFDVQTPQTGIILDDNKDLNLEFDVDFFNTYSYFGIGLDFSPNAVNIDWSASFISYWEYQVTNNG
jgi:hypothetical protein